MEPSKPRLPAFETVPDPGLTLPRAFSISPSVLPLCSIFDYFSDLTREIVKVWPAPSSSAFPMEDLSVMTGFLKVFLPLSNNILILGQQFFSPVEPSWDYALLSLPVLSTDLLESLWGRLKVLLHGLPRLMPLTSFKRFCKTALLVSQKSPGPFKHKMRPYSAWRPPWPQVWTCGFSDFHHDWHRWRPGHDSKQLWVLQTHPTPRCKCEHVSNSKHSCSFHIREILSLITGLAEQT